MDFRIGQGQESCLLWRQDPVMKLSTACSVRGCYGSIFAHFLSQPLYFVLSNKTRAGRNLYLHNTKPSSPLSTTPSGEEPIQYVTPKLKCIYILRV